MLVLDDETKWRLIQFLDNELFQCWSERSTLVEDWIQWEKDYWAKPSQTTKNFPFRKAANVVIPMTAIAVETILARMVTTIFSVKPFYSIRARTSDWVEAAPEVESWLQTEVEDPNALDVYGFARESLLELIKLGTGIGKSGYEKDIRKVNTDNPDGSSTPRYVVRRDGATLDHVPLANFLMRLHERDPQSAVWCGEEHSNVTWAQAKRHALSGRWDPEELEKVKTYFSQMRNQIGSTADKFDGARRAEENDEPAWTDTLAFQEIWMSFDVDGDGIDEEIVIDYHRDSQAILARRYNWYEDTHRPYRIGVFIPVSGRWTGIGVGKQLEQFQALITTIHRQRLDAGTLANIGQLALKKTSGYGANEPIWPGKIWFLDEPRTDIVPIQFSNTQHFAQISNEDNARQYADKRSGANELILGTPHVGTPATATSDLAKLAEGNKKFDFVLKNVRRWYSLLGLDTLANYQQFGSRGRTWVVRGEGGEWVEKFLEMPQQDVRRGAFIDLTVTDSITNKDVEQQKWLNLFQVLTMHYDKVLERAGQVSGLMQDPTLFIMFGTMALKASNEAMTRLLGAAGVPDPSGFLLDIDKILGGQDGSEEGGTEETRLIGGSPGLLGTTGVAEFARAFGATGGGGGAVGPVSIGTE